MASGLFILDWKSFLFMQARTFVSFHPPWKSLAELSAVAKTIHQQSVWTIRTFASTHVQTSGKMCVELRQIIM